jgi:hypothetical protein
MKGSIQPGHIPVNKYQLLVVGLPLLTPTTVSGIEEEIAAIDMPDHTKVSGGNTGPSECTIMIPMHHTIEHAAMEAWFAEGQDPVTPTYKKAASLIMQSGSLVGPTRTYSLVGVWTCKRKLPDLELKNDGEMAQAEWTLYIDQVLPG